MRKYCNCTWGGLGRVKFPDLKDVRKFRSCSEMPVVFGVIMAPAWAHVSVTYSCLFSKAHCLFRTVPYEVIRNHVVDCYETVHIESIDRDLVGICLHGYEDLNSMGSVVQYGRRNFWSSSKNRGITYIVSNWRPPPWTPPYRPTNAASQHILAIINNNSIFN